MTVWRTEFSIAVLLQPLLFLAVVAVYETATVMIRSDHRSLSDVLAGTATVTRRSLEATEGAFPSKASHE
jgi:hypothetical protein